MDGKKSTSAELNVGSVLPVSSKSLLKFKQTKHFLTQKKQNRHRFSNAKSTESFDIDELMAMRSKRKTSLSQRSLDEMSLLYTATPPMIKEEDSQLDLRLNNDSSSPPKALSEHSYLTERSARQPRLSQFFNDEIADPKSASSSASTKSKLHKVVSLPNYCFLCGYGGNNDRPLLNPCECPVQVHTTCLIQHIKLHKNITCTKCELLYNINFGHIRPIWKWHCPYDRKWRKCSCHIGSWFVLVLCIVLVFIGPVFQIIELSETATIVVSIFLLIILCWCIAIIMRTGVKSVFYFIQAFCLTNYDVQVNQRLKGSPEDLKTRLLYMLTYSKKRFSTVENI